MSFQLNTSHSLDEWLDHILAIHPTEIELGLTRLRQVATRMGLTVLPESDVITVAGTNGKGTTCALLAEILSRSGYRVGVFSSPHIEHYVERVSIDGQPLPEQEHVDAFAAISKACQETSLTFFEYSALGALYLFHRHKPDIVLLAEGLGGRLDATNLIEADVAVVTTIGLDHQEYLGTDRESIGFEKAGIFREATPAVCGDPMPPDSIAQSASATSAPLYQRNRDFFVSSADKHWSYKGRKWKLDQLPIPAIPLDNAATALATLEQRWPDIEQEALCQALSQVSVPGRLERLSESPSVVMDVAHNPQAAAYLAAWLAKQHNPRVLAVCAMLEDKDIEATLAELSTSVDAWYVASLDVNRGAQAERLAQCVQGAKLHISVAEALDSVVDDAADEDLVILFGSFYTVAQAKEHWRKRILA